MVKLLGVLTITALVANTTTTLMSFWLLASTTPRAAALDDAGEDGEDGEDADTAEDGATLASATAAPRGSGNERARRAERNAERILGYSPFCPTCGPAAAVPPDAIATVEPGTTELTGAQRSTLPLVVAATMEAEDPSRSLATLVDTTRGAGGLYGVGDRLGPDVEILSVATGVVHIRNAGKLEYIPFDALPIAPPPKPEGKDEGGKGKASKDAPADDSRKIPGAADAIQCSGKGDCVVDRAFVEELIANPKLLLNQGGATPTTTPDGAPGFRLRGVRKGTLPDLLGLKNGDVITEVGGSPLTMEVLSGLYGKLRHASHLEVTVDRKGDRMTRQLEIRS